MPAITFNKFDLGIDLRKGPAVSDANRLREMKNAHVTTGLATQKRPGLTKVATLEPGTAGLFAAFGKLHTFSSTPVAHDHALFQNHAVPHSTDVTAAVADVPFMDVFNAKIYVAVRYASGVTQHHYLDGGAITHITDVNCPHTGAMIKLQSKLYAVGSDGDVVRYSATGNPKDWTTASDAGFLPTGLNSRGDRVANALGVYQGQLVVLSRDSAQAWQVDPDPTAMKLETIVDNVGTSHPRTVANVAGDLYFLSDYGFRSITTLQMTNNLADVDVGSPIDPMVRFALREQQDAMPRAFYYYGTGQYICAMRNRLFVYSISRTARIAAWSQYWLPADVDAFAELGQEIYLRCGDDVYKLDDTRSDDDGVFFEVLIDMAYMDLKSPGQLKHVYGADVVIEGECEFSVGYDSRDPDAYTLPVPVRGNTRPGGMIPVGCTGTEIALRFRNYSGDPFRLDAVTLHYDILGPL